jgi:hypothetical protein
MFIPYPSGEAEEFEHIDIYIYPKAQTGIDE